MKKVHVYDHPLRPNQKTVTTICFKRVVAWHSRHITEILPGCLPLLDCAGCRAVLIERLREAK